MGPWLGSSGPGRDRDRTDSCKPVGSQLSTPPVGPERRDAMPVPADLLEALYVMVQRREIQAFEITDTGLLAITPSSGSEPNGERA